MSVVLQARAVGRRFGELEALRDVSLEVAEGELVAVIGPNGAGKTTLLSILAGTLPASSGTVLPGPDRVGWAPQQAAVYGRLSVRENLELFAHLEGVPDARSAVRRMLEQTGLAEREGELVERLSGGNRQRVSLALALIAEPLVIALDEPSASLDPVQRGRLWEFVRGLALRGTGVLFSSHDVVEASRVADRLLVLAAGRLLFAGTPAELERAAGVEPGGDFEQAVVGFLARAAPRASA